MENQLLAKAHEKTYSAPPKRNDSTCIPSHRPLLIKAWNSVSSIFPRSQKQPGFSLDAITQAALRRVGVSAFKNNSFRGGLHGLLDALNRGQRMHPFGRTFARQLFIEMLAHRLRLERLMDTHPEICAEKISRPLIVLGLPRSGTTLLFNLLAQDPVHRFMANWEAFIGQVPPKGRYSFNNDPRRRKSRGVLLLQRHLTPDIDKVHVFNSDGPEECTPVLMQSFATQAFAGQFNVPEFASWLDANQHDATYRHHKKVLQTLQWKYPGERWLLKSPDHLPAIESIMKIHPEACVVHIHRDPVRAVSSWASLNLLIRGTYYPHVDAHELGQHVLNRLANDMDRYVTHRNSNDDQRFHDLHFKRFMKDPIGGVRTIYAQFGFQFTDEFEGRMRTYLKANPRHQHGVHGYSPEKFGLTAKSIRHRFGKYVKYFDVHCGVE